jgi:hypothetical protein
VACLPQVHRLLCAPSPSLPRDQVAEALARLSPQRSSLRWHSRNHPRSANVSANGLRLPIQLLTSRQDAGLAVLLAVSDRTSVCDPRTIRLQTGIREVHGYQGELRRDFTRGKDRANRPGKDCRGCLRRCTSATAMHSHAAPAQSVLQQLPGRCKDKSNHRDQRHADQQPNDR